MVANVDQVVVTAAAADPPPVPQLIDRLLVIAEANHLAPVLVINKVDLAAPDDLVDRYRRAGYLVFPTSVATGEGVDQVAQQLHDRVSVVTGPSGVGKTSLLNAIQPGVQLRVGEVSARVRRGRHTTVSAIMIPLDEGGFLVDTPGFSEVGLWGLAPRALGHCFPEFRAYADLCRYADCVHHAEPDCAIREAVEEGHVDPERYRSYLTLLDELRTAPKAWE